MAYPAPGSLPLPTPLILLSEAPVGAETSTFGEEEGAECQFLGVVRGTEDGRPIRGIEYTAYRPMADRELEKLCARAAETHGPHRVEIRHRLGFVAAREPSILIRIYTGHSAPAFELCRWYLKEIKTSVPIWKKPIFSDA